MISSYTPPMRRQLLSKHFLMLTMPKPTLDELVKFTTVARFEPHHEISAKAIREIASMASSRVACGSLQLSRGGEILLNVLEFTADLPDNEVARLIAASAAMVSSPVLVSAEMGLFVASPI